ncbi:hypothetical protein KFU94_58475 [Chloroflexi bacterium TSY]|nr:hypothetical protein [Chloroflexi bacterium TSY]
MSLESRQMPVTPAPSLENSRCLPHRSSEVTVIELSAWVGGEMSGR